MKQVERRLYAVGPGTMFRWTSSTTSENVPLLVTLGFGVRGFRPLQAPSDGPSRGCFNDLFNSGAVESHVVIPSNLEDYIVIERW